MDELNILLSKIRSGDDYSFSELTRKYEPLLAASARKTEKSIKDIVPRSEMSFDDLYQEASLALYKAAMKYDEKAKGQYVSFGLYAKICINNAMISQIRHANSIKRKSDKLISSNEKELSSPGSSAFVIDESFFELSKSKLSDYEMKVLSELIDGKSVGEVAQSLGKTNKSVSNAIFRLKNKLKIKE